MQKLTNFRPTIPTMMIMGIVDYVGKDGESLDIKRTAGFLLSYTMDKIAGFHDIVRNETISGCNFTM